MDSVDSLSSPAEHLSETTGQDALPKNEEWHHMETHVAIEKAMNDNPGDEPAQLDAIAKIRRYFRGTGRAVGIVDSYVKGSLDVHEAVRQIAVPIEHAYTTADGGRLFVYEETVAREQRGFHDPDTAREMWGPEEDLGALEARVTDPEDAPTVEGQLWDLYYTILHAARKTPWRDGDAQQRLMDLLAALKARPDPDRPAGMTTALGRHWIYAGGSRLWGELDMFGPSARESWNDFPGCGAGWYPPETRAWANVNAFVARLAGQDIKNFGEFGAWALREALDEAIEVRPDEDEGTPSIAYVAEHRFEVAAVWIRFAGQYMFDRLLRDGEDRTNENYNLWARKDWERWQKRFKEEAARVKYSPTATAVAGECAEIMSRIALESKADK